MILNNLILFDGPQWQALLPLSFTRPVAELRVGIRTLREKWERVAEKVSWQTQDFLALKYPAITEAENIFVAACVLPDPDFVKAISALKFKQGLTFNGNLVAFKFSTYNPESITETIEFKNKLVTIEHPWDIFEKNDVALRFDFEQIAAGSKTAAISKTNNLLAPENIFVEQGAKLEFVTIDATEGPVYIGEGAEIMPGALIKGSLALCEHATIKMGAKIYGATTIGPWCKVGGEIQNSVLQAYSNKGHDGYLGNAVLGEWCNLGADTNNSNLKNNYDKVKMWDYATEKFAPTGLQFCGLIMGDHSKCGINTMFNTGTVVGVSANIFGSGFPRNFVPSFSWGGASGFSVYPFEKALETARIVMGRRKLSLDEQDLKILQYIFNYTDKYRRF